MHIAVVEGGLSSEREVSLDTGKALAEACQSLGHDVTRIDMGMDLAHQLQACDPDVVCNALHGTYGEDGCVAGLCEILGLKYTHSGVRASALAMHKPTAKILMEQAGVCVVPGVVVEVASLAGTGQTLVDPLPRPYILKPLEDGSSVGVHIVDADADEPAIFASITHYKQLLAEPYIAGREWTVGVLQAPGMAVEPLGVMEIKPKEGFYTYQNKYTSGNTEYLSPPPGVEEDVLERACAYACNAHEAIGCRTISRTDMRYSDPAVGGDGRIYVLEINTHPGMTPTSLVPKLAAAKGLPFPRLVERLLQGAQCDYQPHSSQCLSVEVDA